MTHRVSCPSFDKVGQFRSLQAIASVAKEHIDSAILWIMFSASNPNEF